MERFALRYPLAFGRARSRISAFNGATALRSSCALITNSPITGMTEVDALRQIRALKHSFRIPGSPQPASVVGSMNGYTHFLSYTDLLVTFFPSGPVRMIVTVRDLPSGSITMCPVPAGRPPFLRVTL